MNRSPRLLFSVRIATACFAVAGLLAGGVLELRAEEKRELHSASRAEMFEQLDRDVALLELHGSVLKRVVQLCKPSVVHIDAQKSEPTTASAGRRRTVEEAGSGVIVEINGKNYVLTNRHVIKNAELAAIKIGLADGRQITPSRVWDDPGTDVAVMLVTAEKLTPCRLGNSEKIEIGDFVLAMGSPFGLSHSVSHGIISAKGRRDLELGDEGVRYQDFIQTDAAINPGNSGGPLMNLRGEVIGINTAIASNSGGNEGIGFAIPVNMAMVVAKQLVEKGSVSRAFLGVHLDSKFTADVAFRLGLTRREGARVTGITPNSPAADSDLQVGDVILQFNGITIESDSHLVNLVSLTAVESEVPVAILRDGEHKLIRVKLHDRSRYERR